MLVATNQFDIAEGNKSFDPVFTNHNQTQHASGTNLASLIFHVYGHVSELGLVLRGRLSAFQTFTIRSFPRKDEAVWQQRPVLEAQDASDVAAQRSIETSHLRVSGEGVEAESHNPGLADNKEGTVQRILSPQFLNDYFYSMEVSTSIS